MLRYFSIAKIALKNRFASPQKIFWQVVALTLRFLILFSAYRYAYHYFGKDIQGVSFPVAIWSMAFYTILLSFGMRMMFNKIQSDVLSGSVENLFTKPVSYLLTKASWVLGEGFPSFLFNLCIIFFILIVSVGFPLPDYSVMWLFQAFIIVILGLILSLILYAIIGMAAFWLDNATPIYMIIDKTLMVFGGSYMPVAMFPNSMKLFAVYSPFGSALFGTHIFNSNFSQVWTQYVSIQIFWIVILSGVCIFVFRRVSRKLSINGG